MDTLDRLLCTVRMNGDDRVVLVSNFTQTLDLFVDLCKRRGWGYVRLDGTTSVKKRQKLCDELDDRTNNIFCFLLSSKAGGCGLNLVGANRLVLFDPDWNPAVDKQAAARVWRDGQKRRCFVYRMMSTGTIEEKVYQRQLSKEGLQDVMGGAAKDNLVGMEDLKDLFSLRVDTESDTHDTLACVCAERHREWQATGEIRPPDGMAPEDMPRYRGFLGQKGRLSVLVLVHPPFSSHTGLIGVWLVGRPKEEMLQQWAHHVLASTVPDPMFRLAHACDYVTPTTFPHYGKGSKASKPSVSCSLLPFVFPSSLAYFCMCFFLQLCVCEQCTVSKEVLAEGTHEESKRQQPPIAPKRASPPERDWRDWQGECAHSWARCGWARCRRHSPGQRADSRRET